MSKSLQNIILGLGLAVVVLIVGTSFYFLSKPSNKIPFPGGNGDGQVAPDFSHEVKQFESEDEFKDYMSTAQLHMPQVAFMERAMVLESAPLPTADFGVAFDDSSASLSGGGEEAVRYSGTNVQVVGIDEPDIVKTDGKNIFVSTNQYGYPVFFDEPFIEPGFEVNELERIAFPPSRPRGGIHSVNAFPPADLAVSATINETGDLLLHEDTLVVFSGNTIVGYDVANPAQPKELWENKLEDRNGLITSRLLDDQIYIISANYYSSSYPCPIPLMRIGSSNITVPCTDIFHPVSSVSADVTYTVAVIDIETGELEDSVSFIGSRNNSTVYVSPESIYVAYQFAPDMVSFITGFLTENSDLVDNEVVQKISRLQTYDIGNNAKMTEMQEIWSKYLNGINDDERLKLENELENRITAYFDRNKRVLSQSGVMKISTNSLDVVATGSFPGRLLNQFSLDEHNGNLRVATTIDRQFGFLSGFGQFGESANDVYVLNNDLSIIGSVTDLGLTEQIFSARFIGDRGYLVTFRQIDPFYVLDLSDPENPSVEGELKIPGFSSYLHPISGSQVLGVGREGSTVKASLFDVSNPKNPKEVSVYKLSEFWSDIQNTHHAFLLDDKHEIFFLPGGKGGYVLSYENNTLSLERAISGLRAKRAVFINDYLYIVGEDGIVVLNESDWERVNELTF